MQKITVVLLLELFAFSLFAEEKAPLPPEKLLKNFKGCYLARFRFRENGKMKSYDLMKEKITLVEDKGKLIFKHTTVVDEEADGEDTIIIGWKADAEKAKKEGKDHKPFVFPHLQEAWEQVNGDSWKQVTTFAGFAPVMTCTGDFFQNDWGCESDARVKMLRRDSKIKKRKDFTNMTISQAISFPESNEVGSRVVISQGNLKYLVDAEKMTDKLVFIENGVIEYTRIPDERCAAAKD